MPGINFRTNIGNCYTGLYLFIEDYPVPRKGYKATGYRVKQPDPESFIAQQGDMQLFAELAPCPLYVNCRLLAPGLLGTRRVSFRLGWLIEEARFSKGGDYHMLPADVLAWVKAHIHAFYPDMKTATGMDRQEVAELKAEQRAKRKAFEESRKPE